jgi:hypothetical protein
VVSLGIFSEAYDGTMRFGVDSASKNEYQDNSGSKAGRCARLTTFMCRTSRKSGALTYRILMGLSRPAAGQLYFYLGAEEEEKVELE